MGAGFVLTGLLLAITLAGAAVLRWQARPAHAAGLAVASVAAMSGVLAASVATLPTSGAGEPGAAPSVAVLVAVDDDPPAAAETPDAVADPLEWLVVQGPEVVAAIPWPSEDQVKAVREGVATAVDVSESELEAYYAEHGLLVREGRTFMVQTRAGWPARVNLADGYVTVTFG